jgi:hypothetical protein
MVPRLQNATFELRFVPERFRHIVRRGLEVSGFQVPRALDFRVGCQTAYAIIALRLAQWLSDELSGGPW